MELYSKRVRFHLVRGGELVLHLFIGIGMSLGLPKPLIFLFSASLYTRQYH